MHIKKRKLFALPIILSLLTGCTGGITASTVVPEITSEKVSSLSDEEKDILLGLTVQPELSILEGDALDQEVTRIKQEFNRQLFEKYNALLNNIDSDWNRATDITVYTCQENYYKIARTCGFEVAARFYYMHTDHPSMCLDD
ncbi:MAG: hypothetical protein IJY81_08055, partial [Lachnospiraceae bacterium]|nr:hypothetical protein [Lachnospiraceae bacterium]